MANFTICTFKGKPAVQFHHDYGDFEFVLMQDPKNEDGIIFDSNVALTKRLYDMIGEMAIKHIKIFGRRFGYAMDDELTFEDVTKILNAAKNYAIEQQRKLAQR